MPFLVRKMSNIDNIEKMGNASDPSEMLADAPTAEFKTNNNGTLSTWMIDSLSDINNAVLAIAVTSSSISRMDFVVIDTAFLEQQHLQYKQTYAGQDIAIADLQNSHYDIIDITMKKLIDCINVYKAIYTKDNGEGQFYFRYAAGEMKDLLKEAYVAERIDASKLSKNLKRDLGIV